MNPAVLFVDLAAKSVVVLLAAWFLSKLFRKSSAAAKHLVWLSAFCVMIVTPVLTAILPAKTIVIPSGIAGRQLAGATVRPPASVNLRPPAGVAGGWIVPPNALAIKDQPNVGTNLPSLKLRRASPPTATPAGSRTDWALIGSVAVALWLLGAAIVAFQSFYALAAVGRLRRRSWPLEGQEIDRERLARQLGVTRPWELRVCAGPRAPAAMTWGVMNPVVMIPQESASWTQERLEAVLLHELAHVRRFDSVSQLIAVFACIVYWFNPAVWLCARAMRAEAEIAADDTVLGMGVRPSDYARELVRIAADLGTRQQPYSTIGVPVMKKSKIESRVQAILDPSPRRRRGISTVQVLTTAAIAAAIVIPVSMLRATLVPIEPHPILFTHQDGQNDKAKMQAEEAARKAEIDKRSAELAAVNAQMEKRLAEANHKLAEAAKRAAEQADRSAGKADKLAANKEYRAALKAQEQAAKVQKMARLDELNALFKQSAGQKEATKAEKMARAKIISQYIARQHQEVSQVQLKTIMAELNAQRAQLRETQQRLQEALRALKQAKAGQSDQSAEVERAKWMYEKGYISKDQLNSSKQRLAEVLRALKEKQGGKADAASIDKQVKALFEQADRGNDSLDRKSLADLKRLQLQSSGEYVKLLDRSHRQQLVKAQLEQAEANLAAAKAQAADAKARYQAGVTTKVDYDKAVAEANSDQAQMRMLQIVLDGLNKSDKK